MGKITCLHVSDLHIGNSKFDDDMESLVIKLSTNLEDRKISVDSVIVTGDIFDGLNRRDDCIETAIHFFTELSQRLTNKDGELLKNCDFVFVPGNHDIDRDNEDIFKTYKKFLSEFHGESYFNEHYDSKFLCTHKIYEEEKVAFVGLNSCQIKKIDIKAQKLKWLERLDFQDLGIDTLIQERIKSKIDETNRRSIEENWDDFGYISLSQIDKSFRKLKKSIDIHKFQITTLFHHHFYPFPEEYNEANNSSIIRNYNDVIQHLRRSNVRLILHGHKHVSIQRPIVTEKYFKDPDSNMYVFSAGSLGSTRGQNSFQVVQIYSPDEQVTAKVSKSNYDLGEFKDEKTLQIPPVSSLDKSSIKILEKLEEENKKLFHKYNEFILSTNIFHDYNVFNIVENISRCITSFDDCKNRIYKVPTLIYLILITVLLRILKYAENIDKVYERELANNIEEELLFFLKDEEYFGFIIDFVSQIDNKKMLTIYKQVNEIQKFFFYRELTSFVTVTIFYCDLYIILRKHGESYYKRESLNHKVNIKLEDGIFNIPEASIEFTPDVDKRNITISFLCNNPTVHKIAVLILKDLEGLINKLEESFNFIGVKTYYIIPQVRKKGYELEDHNFEAYIPTLLPLLTGENLYKCKESFIRELIQNSYDAIKLREKFDQNDFNKDIKIDFHIVPTKSKEKQKKLTIIDCGTGMNIHTIERYFTSIGRSYYKSDELFDKLTEANKYYDPVSNFGIGFLSSFMVATQVLVKTKSYLSEDHAIKLEIPNYDGCFFINKDTSISDIGTTIELYEDRRKRISEKNIINYVAKTFVNFPLEIKITESTGGVYVHNSYSLRKEIYDSTDYLIYIPVTNHQIQEIDFNPDPELLFLKYQYGVIIRINTSLQKQKKVLVLNDGILVSDADTDFIKTYYSIIYSFGPSLIQLDVSRENINEYKFINDVSYTQKTFRSDLLVQLIRQSAHLIDYIKKYKQEHTFSFINNIYNSLRLPNNMPAKEIHNHLYSIEIKHIFDVHADVSFKYVPIYDLASQFVEGNEVLRIFPNMYMTIKELVLKKELLFKIKDFTKNSLRHYKESLERIMGQNSVMNFDLFFEKSLSDVYNIIEKHAPYLVANHVSNDTLKKNENSITEIEVELLFHYNSTFKQSLHENIISEIEFTTSKHVKLEDILFYLFATTFYYKNKNSIISEFLPKVILISILLFDLPINASNSKTIKEIKIV